MLDDNSQDIRNTRSCKILHKPGEIVMDNKNINTPSKKKNKQGSPLTVVLVVLLTVALVGAGLIYYFLNSAKESLEEELTSAKTERDVANAEVAAMEEELKDYREGPVYTQSEYNRGIKEAEEKAKNQTADEMRAQMKERILSGEGTVPMLRSFFPSEIVFLQDGIYHFVQIDEAVTPRKWTDNNLVITPGEQWYDYQVNGESVVRRGIDVSSFQGDINWSKVAADGIDYAIIRLGIRGYGSGKLVLDTKFEQNIKGALENGIDVAVYFFSEALNEEEAVEEAEFAMEALEPYNIKCTLAIDIEDVNDDTARTKGLTQEQWTNNCIAFCEKVKENGYKPLIYGNMESMILMLDIARLNDYPKWWAAYYGYFYYPYDFTVWQFSEKGKVNGISTNVDLNISFDDWYSMER